MSDKENKDPKGTAGWLGELWRTPWGYNVGKFLIVGVGVGILFMTGPSLFGVDTGRPTAGGAEVPTTVAPLRSASSAQDEIFRLQADVARDLEHSLSRIKGAGRVTVQVTLARGPEVVPVFAEKQQETRTDEKAGDNSTRGQLSIVREKSTVTVQAGNSQSLAVLRSDPAQVAGVLVVAEGAGNDRTRERLHQAVMDTLHIPWHKIRVEEAEGRGQ